MHGKGQRGEERRSRASAAQLHEQEEKQHDIRRMKGRAREVIAHGIAPPQGGVEHERGELHGAVRIQHILPEHAKGEHIAPVRWVMNIIAKEHLRPRIVDKVRPHRARVKEERHRSGQHGPQEDSEARGTRGGHGNGKSSPRASPPGLRLSTLQSAMRAFCYAMLICPTIIARSVISIT